MSENAWFSGDWLTLREPVDHVARSPRLESRLAAWLANCRPDPRPLQVLDLGCGHGSNLRHLAPRLPGAQHWHLVDHDDELLARAAGHPPSHSSLTVHCHQADLAELSSLEIPTPDLVTASALFDLVSAEWIGQLVDQCQRWQAAALLVLTVNGQRGFLDQEGQPCQIEDFGGTPAELRDIRMQELFNQHQRQAKGLGTALGPDAIAELERCFQAAGFPVLVAPSDWQLKVDDDMTRQLGPALLDGWRKAALEVAPDDQALIDRWHADRCRELRAGTLGLRIGHSDLLALPDS